MYMCMSHRDAKWHEEAQRD
jgi:hypothetical protein